MNVSLGRDCRRPVGFEDGRSAVGVFPRSGRHGGVNRGRRRSARRAALPVAVIRKLEKDLRAELFHRLGRGIVLAPAGEALVGPAGRSCGTWIPRARQCARFEMSNGAE